MSKANDAYRSRTKNRYSASYKHEDDKASTTVNFNMEAPTTTDNGETVRHLVPFRLVSELRNDIPTRALSVITEDGAIEIGKINRFGKLVRDGKRLSVQVFRYAKEAAKIMAGVADPHTDSANLSVKQNEGEVYSASVFASTSEDRVQIAMSHVNRIFKGI